MNRQAEMTARAQSAVFSSCRWFTASEISLLHACDLDSMENLLTLWKTDLKVFSVEHRSIDHYPCYAFDEENGFMPAKELKPILQEFNGSRNGWGLAYWFASVNGYLGGHSPQDLLNIAPEKVLAAARAHLIGILHG